MNTNEPRQTPTPQPDRRKAIIRDIAMILGFCLIASPVYSILCSALNLPHVPFSWVVITLIAVIALNRWRSRLKKRTLVSSPSSEQSGPRPRAICGGLSLAFATVGVFCMAKCYLGKDGSFGLLAIALMLVFLTLGFGIIGLARRERPKWPAAAGGLIGASPIVIAILVGVYNSALQPVIERVWRAYLYDAPSKTVDPRIVGAVSNLNQDLKHKPAE